MGCDIHCYIEYKDPNRDHWSGFGGRINPGRNYEVFTLLAGVRNYDEVAVPKPKGMPEDAAWESEGDNRLFISSEFPNGDGNTSPERAAKYVAECNCEYVNGGDGKPAWVTHPDWHSHSWATPDEWEAVIGEKVIPEYRAMLAALRSFEAQGFIARVVYWFDN